jgi:hypothetical protein
LLASQRLLTTSLYVGFHLAAPFSSNFVGRHQFFEFPFEPEKGGYPENNRIQWRN